ncbi:MAG: amidohydrolase family protein [Sphingomonadaceae bacterium]|nr:amidohydrolase family protein [Sphingomonadaceae bacterium]
MPSQEHDIVIRGGTIVDGSGKPPFIGDVAIDGEWISQVGSVTGSGKREIDATGLLVTPGFVDIHTHYDGQLIWSEYLAPSSNHGVTTVVTGNCGIGFAPCRPQDHLSLIELMEVVEDIPEPVTSAGLDWSWETFPEYMDAVESRNHDIDVAVMVPHSALRVYVMGERGVRRERANADEMAQMKLLMREALDVGAAGLGTSRIHVHKSTSGELVPTFGVSQDELITLGSAMAEAGKGVFQMIGEVTGKGPTGDFDIMCNVAEKTGRQVTFTSAQTSAAPYQYRDLLTALKAVNDKGIKVTAQLFPRPIGMMIGLTATANPFCMAPAWQEIVDLPLDEKVARMREPEMRRRLIDEAPGEPKHPLFPMSRDFSQLFSLEVESPNYEPDESTNMQAQADAAGVPVEEFVYDKLLEDGGKNLLIAALGNFALYNLDHVVEMLSDPNVVVGLGDGGAHYGMICDASYPTTALTHWVRDRDGTRFSLEEMVKTLTRDPAEVFGLNDRGLLQPGYRAHANLIDHENLTLFRPEVVNDLPGGGRRLHQDAKGYVMTIVNGQVARENDQPAGALPGHLLRGPQEPQLA